MRMRSAMKFVSMVRKEATIRAFVAFAKSRITVAACWDVSDYVALTWIGAYQDLVEMAELYCEVSGTRKV